MNNFWEVSVATYLGKHMGSAVGDASERGIPLKSWGC